MILHNLPQGAWERVVEHLNKHSFVAFAQTCTKFREEAYRYLYRSSVPMMLLSQGYCPLSFEEFMRAPRRQTVKREFFEGKSFHKSSSSEVTKMTHLVLHQRWSDWADATDIRNWIEDIHPESTFDVLTVDIEGVEEGKVHALFQNLDKFNGLICLVVRGSFSQSTIDSIRCASLRQLDLHHPTFIPWIGSHASCPKLKSIRYLLPSRRPRIMNEDEMLEYDYNTRWDRLQQLMKESINFVFLQGQSMENPLIPFVLFYAEEKGLDPTPMMSWIIKSFLVAGGFVIVPLNLERFIPAHRDAFIDCLRRMLPTILSTKFITPSQFMSLHLRSWDQLSFAATLPDTFYALQIRTADRLNPELVPEIIRHQHDLKCLTVTMSLTKSSDETYSLESQAASCTHASPYPLPSNSLPFSPVTDELWVFTWLLEMRADGHGWFSGTSFRDSTAPKYVGRGEDILPEVVAEVRGWFNMNAKFKVISLYFVGGGSIDDWLNRDMYWKDTGFVELDEFM